MTIVTHTPKATRVFYTCRRKSCRAKAVVNFEAFTIRSIGAYGRPVYTRTFVTAVGRERDIPARTCHVCGTEFMDGKELRGRFSADVPCDSRCTSATGHNCECSCGGRNHGKDAA